ncbi:MAG: hypothetical protein C7B45_02430 [Sulfobacillus acidophilus]|uniref:Uncharacterized protein n=1 Tax=Sulfobacillus acidophilus TaxID=53633 RepID=A0A2T2WN36_9FIRM|nr:MAG: hypothetical protein C7B45_02430 [Sulfobacillus acidophilus]
MGLRVIISRLGWGPILHTAVLWVREGNVACDRRQNGRAFGSQQATHAERMARSTPNARVIVSDENR